MTVSLLEVCWSKWPTLWLKRPGKIYSSTAFLWSFPSCSQLSYSGCVLPWNWMQISCTCDFSGERVSKFCQILEKLMYPKGLRATGLSYLLPYLSWYACSLFVFLSSRVWIVLSQTWSVTIPRCLCVSLALVLFNYTFSDWPINFWVLLNLSCEILVTQWFTLRWWLSLKMSCLFLFLTF